MFGKCHGKVAEQRVYFWLIGRRQMEKYFYKVILQT